MNYSRILRFTIAGGVAAIVNFCSRFWLSEVFSYAVAIVLAYCIGKGTAFLLNRPFVFPGALNRLRNQIGWFTAVNVAAVAQTLVLSLLFARLIFPRLGMSLHPEAVAHAIGIVVPVFTSYFSHKHFSFRSPA